jgi:hypothetical protein
MGGDEEVDARTAGVVEGQAVRFTGHPPHGGTRS